MPSIGAMNEEQISAEQRRLRDLRVSDREREHVVELLKTAIGRGLIDLDEFSERADTAYAARTRGELNKVLVDLPGLSHPEAIGVAATATTAARAWQAGQEVAGLVRRRIAGVQSPGR